MLFQNLLKLRHFQLIIRYSSNKITKNKEMSAEYNAVLKYWFGEDLTLLKSDKYTGNNLVKTNNFDYEFLL